MRTKKLALIALACVQLSGCSTVKGWLRPWVCDCSQHATHAAKPPTEVADAHEETHGEGSGDHDDDPHDPSPDVTEPEVADEAAHAAVSLDWREAVDVSQALERERISKAYLIRGGVDADQPVLEGRFGPRNQAEAVVLVPGKTIEIYSESARVAQGKLDLTPAPAEFGPFLRGAELVRDGRLEIVVIGIRRDAVGSQEVVFSVWKVIGLAVARVFERPIATFDGNSWRRVADVRVLAGAKNRFIEVVPSTAGQPKEVYRWNRWEGLYRIPTPAPTAPHRAMRREVRVPLSRQI